MEEERIPTSSIEEKKKAAPGRLIKERGGGALGRGQGNHEFL